MSAPLVVIALGVATIGMICVAVRAPGPALAMSVVAVSLLIAAVL